MTTRPMLPSLHGMQSARVIACMLLGAVLAAAGDPLPLLPGKRVNVDMPAAASGSDGTSQAFALSPAVDGPLTVSAQSLDGDVLLRLLDESGASLAEDDNGGVEGNARLVIADARAGQPLRLLAVLKPPAAAGSLSIEALSGVVPPPEGAALAEARGLFLQARGLHRQERGEAGPAAADLGKAGDLLYRAERFAAARDTFEALIPLLEQRGDTQRLTYARGFLACSLSRLDDLSGALPLLDEAALESAQAGYKPLEMMVVSELATLRRKLGLTAQAEEATARALQLARELGDRGNEVILLTQLARARLALGRPDEALTACEEAEALASELAIPPLQLEALAVNAEYASSRGNHRGARARYEEALALPVTPWRRANLLGALGDEDRFLGDMLSAASRYREAASLASTLGDPALLATITLGLGVVQLDLGDPAAARDAFEAALAAYGEGGVPANRAAALLQLAKAQLELGERPAALRSSEAARTAARSAADLRLESQAVFALADADRLDGDSAGRLVHSREALALLAGARRPLDEAVALANVAQAELRAGHAERAVELGQQALTRLTALRCERETLHPLCTLADAAIRSGDAETAARLLEQAEQTLQRLGARFVDRAQLGNLRSGETEHSPGQLAQDLAALRLQQAGADPVKRDAAVDAGLRACGEWKGHSLLNGLERQRDGGDNAAAERLLTERRRNFADRDAVVVELVAAEAAGEPDAEQDALRARIAALDAHAAELAGSLAQLSPREADFEQVAPWGLSPLRALLGPRDVYVEYAESTDRLYAYVVTPTRADLRDLGPLTQRRAEVAAFLSGLSDPAHLAGVAQVAQGGSALYAALLGSVLPADVPADARLLIVPSALVSQLPFEALVVKSPAAPKGFRELVFVLDEHEVTYAPSGPVLALMKGSAPRATQGRALVMADPVYPPATTAVPRGSRDPRSLGFVRLPGTRDEALGIAQRLLESWSSVTANSDAQALLAGALTTTDVALDTPALRLYLGEQATAAALQGDLREFALIHCATHGHVDAQDPRLTGLALTPTAADDGYVTLADVLELSLDADLAVLSACETGLGRERRGEGTQSLARAFLHAGARSVVSSLWQVDDRETERTMQGFYSGLAARDLTASAALREARLAIRREPAAPGSFRGLGRGKLLSGDVTPTPTSAPAPAPVGQPDLAGHPFFWAAFTYIGPPDFRPLAAPK